MIKNSLPIPGVAAVASFAPNHEPLPGSDRRSGEITGKPSPNPKSSLASWCATIVVFMAVIIMGLAVAAVLLGDK